MADEDREGEGLYETLGVDKTATPDEIKKAYRKLALKHHPDKNLDNPDAAEKFKKINKANATLMNPVRRSLYDKYGGWGVDFAEQFGDETGSSLLKMDNCCFKLLLIMSCLLTGCCCCFCCCGCCGKCKDKDSDYNDLDGNEGGDGGGGGGGGNETDVINKQPTASYHSCGDDGTVPIALSGSGVSENDELLPDSKK